MTGVYEEIRRRIELVSGDQVTWHAELIADEVECLSTGDHQQKDTV